MPTATNGHVEVAYETFGPTGGAPLLLVCGASTQMIHWPEGFVAALVEHGFRVARFGTIETWVRLFPLMGTPRYPVDEGWIRDVTGRTYGIAHDPTADRRQLAACPAAGDRRAELAHVRAPTLVVHGEADPRQSVRAGRATAAAIPGAELHTFPDVGHGLIPEPLWPRLLRALDELRARAPG